MTIVTRCLSSSTSSSIFSVAIGSSALAGSSISSTSGSTASARAMHSRCCWPPDSEMPGEPSRSLTSFHSPAPRSAPSTCSASTLREVSRSPAATLSKIDIVGNGLGFWKTMPIARRTATTSTPSA